MGRLIFALTAGYLFIMLFMYIFQRSFQYAPDRNAPGTPAYYGVPQMQPVRVKTADGIDLLAWFAPPKDKNGKIIVYYHGNAGTIAERADKVHHYTDKGYGFFLLEYRGYGGNAGSPSEQGLYTDARAAIAWLEAQGYSRNQFVIYGESIGSGVATQISSEIAAKWLILEAPLSSAADVAKTKYFWLPVDFLLIDKFDNFAKIQKMNPSLLIVHGDIDATVPMRLSQKLFEVAKHPKEYVMIKDAGHADLYDHGAGKAILEWLARQ